MYTEKVVQLMRYFAEKLGGSVSDVKLMKLLYFSDRLAIKETGYPLSYDEYFSLNRGPVLSGAKNLIDKYSNPIYKSVFHSAVPGESPAGFPINVATLISKGSDTENIENPDFDLLSSEDREIINRVLVDLGGLDDDKVVLYSHDSKNCPEWVWPNGSRESIDVEFLLKKLGYSPEQCVSHAAEIKYFKKIVAK